MEGMVLLGLLGAGYALNKDKSQMSSEYKPPLHSSFNTSTSVYDVNHFKDSQVYEKAMVQKFNDMSKRPNSKIIAPTHLNQPRTKGSSMIQSMSGAPISTSNFLTDDRGVKVEPFFSGSGPSNVRFDENRDLLSHQGGAQAFRPPKKEIGQMFGLQKTYGNVYGNQFEGASADKDRYIGGSLLTNELPFQQERTPPIDSKSDINRDIGNIHAERNSVDNQRSLNNPKLSYEGTILGGKGHDKREEQPEVFKHLPDRDYLNTADKWLVTTGATDAAMIRPGEIVPDTNRQYLNEGKLGPAAPVVFETNEQRPMFKKSTNQQLSSDTMRNATMEGMATDDSHNKDSYFVYPNERETTTDNYFVTNPTPVYEADTTRPQDIMKATIKETTTYAHTGNGGTHVPGTMASDQYLRADLNPNKEIISQGREPTPSNVSLTNGMDTIHMTIDKIEKDYFNHHIANMDKVYQEIPTDMTCKYTRNKETLNNRKLSDRLDPTNLDPFRTNPYTHSLASFS